ncbi:MAG: hypothetical protein ABI321_00730 [Polyangia bacterium]
MRFCPFCAQENSDDASECAHCGRKLPVVATAPVAPAMRSIPAVPPRRAPRPFARTRPLTPAPAPLTRVDPPVEPATPQLVVDTGSRARSGTLLGIPARPLDRDAATRVEGPTLRHDGVQQQDYTDEEARLAPAPETTEQVPRYDDDPVDNADTAIRTMPNLPVRPPLPEPELGALDATDTQIRVPPVHVPAPTPRPRGDGRAPPMPLPPPPMPLPPPPMAKTPPRSVLSLSRPSSLSGLAPPLPEAPRLEADGQVPLLPEAEPLELPTRSTRRPTQSRVEPIAQLPIDVAEMPPHPPQKIWPSVLYLVPLARAIWSRHNAKRALGGLLHDDQRRVDQALRDLGEAAWQMQPRPPELKPELDRADADEQKRIAAEHELARLDLAVEAERSRWADEESQRKSEIGKHQNEVKKLVEQVTEQRRAQKVEEQTLRELELKLRSAERKLQQLLLRVAKAETTPPAKGGGEAAVSMAREQAEIARTEIDGHAPLVEEQHGKARAYDAPLAELEKHLADEHQQVAVQEAELDAARKTSAQTLASLELEHVEQDGTRLAAERGVRLRLVATGTLLSLHRMDETQSGGAFSPLYRALDELQTVASQREARIAELDEERQGYDRAAVQRGLIAVGGVVGLLAILAIVLIVIVKH